MSETIVFANQGDTVVVKVGRVPDKQPFDERAHQEGLDRYRQFVESHWGQIEDLLGGKPEDQDSLLMDAERELPDIIDAVRKSRIPQPELVSLTAGIFRSSGRWNGPPEKAGDMAERFVDLLGQVAQGIPKK